MELDLEKWQQNIMTNKQKAVCILSAPRSGSSALASLVADMGLHLGAENTLKEGDDFNPKGYYELKQVLDINEQILMESIDSTIWEIGESLGWSKAKTVKIIEYYTWTVARNPVRAEDVSGKTREEVENFIRSITQEQQTLLLKDARMCATLPVWEEYIDPVCIVLWRHPAEVQRSLGKMTGIPQKIALQLWYAYNRLAFIVSEKYPRICLSYQELIENPREVQKKLGDLFRNEGISISLLDDSRESSIEASLFRNRNRGGVDLTSKQTELYGALAEKDYEKIANIEEEDSDRALLPLIGMVNHFNGELSRRPGRRYLNAIADIYHSIFGR